MVEKKKDKRISFRKIIYFDEGSATDLIYMVNEGEILESIINTSNDVRKLGAGVDGSVGSGVNIISLLKAKLNLRASASIDIDSEKLVNQAITNTVLTDYLALDKDSLAIKTFHKAKVRPYPNSISYLKLFTPYLSMTEGIQQYDNINIDMRSIDKTLTQSKGYYEMVLEDDDAKSVLRFNLNAFHNSYSLGDLVKMELTFHAVKVGKMKLDELDISNEFKFSLGDNDLDGCTEALKDVGLSSSDSSVDVFDVVLAGVEND